MAEATLPLLDAAVAEDRFETALALHELAGGAVARSTKTELRNAFRRRGEQIAAQQTTLEPGAVGPRSPEDGAGQCESESGVGPVPLSRQNPMAGGTGLVGQG